MKKQDIHTQALLLKWLDGSITASEEAQLDKAALDDPFLAGAMDGFRKNPALDYEAALQRMNASNGGQRARVVLWPRYAAVAASLLLLIVAGWWWMGQYSTADGSTQLAEEAEAFQRTEENLTAASPTILEQQSGTHDVDKPSKTSTASRNAAPEEESSAIAYAKEEGVGPAPEGMVASSEASPPVDDLISLESTVPMLETDDTYPGNIYPSPSSTSPPPPPTARRDTEIVLGDSAAPASSSRKQNQADAVQQSEMASGIAAQDTLAARPAEGWDAFRSRVVGNLFMRAIRPPFSTTVRFQLQADGRIWNLQIIRTSNAAAAPFVVQELQAVKQWEVLSGRAPVWVEYTFE